MVARSLDRRDTSLSARIVSGPTDLACVVRDVSARGARLRVRDPNVIPQEFQLIFDRTGETRRAQVRWRRMKDVGVVFLQERRSFGQRLQAPAEVAEGT